ncbi:MAG: hypothetical protein ACFCU4_02960 [Puniceicoccaceae bacterium]
MNEQEEAVWRDRLLYLILGWGGIGAKCFVLEAMTQHFDLPIRSVPFIWLPTLTVGLFCTILYLRGSMQVHGDPPNRVYQVYLGELVLAVLLLWVLIGVPHPHLPLACSLFSATLLWVASVWRKSLPFAFLAAAWTFGSGILVWKDEAEAYAWYGLMLGGLLFAPALFWVIRGRRPAF